MKQFFAVLNIQNVRSLHLNTIQKIVDLNENEWKNTWNRPLNCYGMKKITKNTSKRE